MLLLGTRTALSAGEITRTNHLCWKWELPVMRGREQADKIKQHCFRSQHVFLSLAALHGLLDQGSDARNSNHVAARKLTACLMKEIELYERKTGEPLSGGDI